MLYLFSIIQSSLLFRYGGETGNYPGILQPGMYMPTALCPTLANIRDTLKPADHAVHTNM